MSAFTYTVGVPGEDPETFTEPRKAAEAFHRIEAVRRPYVIGVTTRFGRESGCFLADTIRWVESGGGLKFGKNASGCLDPAFASAYAEVCQQEKTNVRITEPCDCCGGTGKIRESEWIDGDLTTCWTCLGAGEHVYDVAEVQNTVYIPFP